MDRIGNERGLRLPLMQMPTTADTGSEVNPIPVVTTAATTKMRGCADGADRPERQEMLYGAMLARLRF